MRNVPRPLHYMGTQSQETLALEAARAQHGRACAEEHADGFDAGGKISAATDWVTDKARDALRSAGSSVRDGVTSAVARRTKADPIRAILIAAGVGAVLMSLVAHAARAGARTVRRNVQR